MEQVVVRGCGESMEKDGVVSSCSWKCEEECCKSLERRSEKNGSSFSLLGIQAEGRVAVQCTGSYLEKEGRAHSHSHSHKERAMVKGAEQRTGG